MKKLVYSLLAVLLLVGCNEKLNVDHYKGGRPQIYSFTPTTGSAGTKVTIYGENLGNLQGVFLGPDTALAFAPTKYHVSQSELEVTIPSNARSGCFWVALDTQLVSTVDTFQVIYPQPVVSSWPDSGRVYRQIVLEGENLQVIDRVMIDTLHAPIIAKYPGELVFEVPFFADENKALPLRLIYYNAEGEQALGPEGATFYIKKQTPVIQTCPASLTKYEPIAISGEVLSLIEYLMVGEEKVSIVFKSDNELIIDMPANYFGGEMTGDLVAYYYGGAMKMVICENFHVISDPNEPRYYTYKNVTLSGRTASGGENMPFFDGETGAVISTCDAKSQMMDIDFLLYDNSGYAQLYSPANTSSILKNYKCVDDVTGLEESIVTGSEWADFQKIATKFRVLNPANTAQKRVIDAYEAGTIISLDEAFFTGVSAPSSSAPKVYLSNDQTSNLSVDHYPYAWIHNFATDKDGIMKVTGAKEDKKTGKTYEITFDIIWEK